MTIVLVILEMGKQGLREFRGSGEVVNQLSGWAAIQTWAVSFFFFNLYLFLWGQGAPQERN